MMEKTGRQRYIIWIFAGLLVLGFLVFGWRQFFGFNKNDEIFYISTVYRFFQGDAMLIDEWNNGQLFAFITYPIFMLVRLFHNSNDGVVLIFRFLYLIFQAAVATYCFVRLKRFGWIRIFPALFYFVTTPYNINALSYNTLVLGFVLLTLVTVASADEIKTRDAVLCGVFIAGAVLSNPYAVILFVLYGCICAGCSLYGKRTGRKPDSALSFRTFFFMGVGAFIIFVLFVAFVFSRGTLQEILEGFSYIVMDSERQKDFWEKLSKYFIRIHRYYKIEVYVTGILLLLRLADRKRKIPDPAYLAVSVISAIPYIIYYGFFWEMVGINYMLIPLSFPGLTAYVVSTDKDRRLFYGWYVPGVIYTLAAHFATNTGIYTVSAAYMIAGAASMLLIWKAVKEHSAVWLRILVCILLVVQFAGCIWQRIFYVWGDEHLPELNVRLETGPMEGIYTTEENAGLYGDVLQDMDDLELTSQDKLFVVGIAPWMYLYTDAECASHSTWETLETDPLIRIYYELHPEKLPTVVYYYQYEEDVLDTDLAYYFKDMGYEALVMRRGIVLQRR